MNDYTVCPKCSSSLFVMKRINVESPYVYLSIQCKECNNIIGTTEYGNVSNSLNKVGTELEEKIDKILKLLEKH